MDLYVSCRMRPTTSRKESNLHMTLRKSRKGHAMVEREQRQIICKRVCSFAGGFFVPMVENLQKNFNIFKM